MGLPPICPMLFAAFIFQGEEYCVMQDYYQEDGIRIPLTYPDAKELAEDNQWEIPTREMVDAIWVAADCKLSPITMTPDSEMTSQSRWEEHDELIDRQLGNKECNIIAGHKKDVIDGGNGYVTIYGWHRRNGQPIQPVYSGHGEYYRDYSHGVRFIFRR